MTYGHGDRPALENCAVPRKGAVADAEGVELRPRTVHVLERAHGRAAAIALLELGAARAVGVGATHGARLVHVGRRCAGQWWVVVVAAVWG